MSFKSWTDRRVIYKKFFQNLFSAWHFQKYVPRNVFVSKLKTLDNAIKMFSWQLTHINIIYSETLKMLFIKKGLALFKLGLLVWKSHLQRTQTLLVK